MTESNPIPAAEREMRRRYANLELAVVVVTAVLGLCMAWAGAVDRRRSGAARGPGNGARGAGAAVRDAGRRAREIPAAAASPVAAGRHHRHVLRRRSTPGGMRREGHGAGDRQLFGRHGCRLRRRVGPRLRLGARHLRQFAAERGSAAARPRGKAGSAVNRCRPKEQERAYVFASAVRRGNALIGVIAIYVRMDQVEQTWALSANPIAVTDASGAIFISNRPAWQSRRLFGAGGDARACRAPGRRRPDRASRRRARHLLSRGKPSVAADGMDAARACRPRRDRCGAAVGGAGGGAGGTAVGQPRLSLRQAARGRCGSGSCARRPAHSGWKTWCASGRPT